MLLLCKLPWLGFSSVATALGHIVLWAGMYLPEVRPRHEISQTIFALSLVSDVRVRGSDCIPFF